MSLPNAQMQNSFPDLNRAVIDAVERERRLFAEELHQTTSQNLVALLFGVERFARLVKAGKPVDPAEAGEIVELARHASEEVRTLISNVAPLRQGSGGLILALGNLADTTAKKVPCEFICETPVRFEHLEKERALLSIAQEAVRNAVQHAGATRIVISLVETKEGVVLTIQDNGCGFSPAPVKVQVSGIDIMRCHAAAAGGELVINTTPGAGTAVRCALQKSPSNHAMNSESPGSSL